MLHCAVLQVNLRMLASLKGHQWHVSYVGFAIHEICILFDRLLQDFNYKTRFFVVMLFEFKRYLYDNLYE